MGHGAGEICQHGNPVLFLVVASAAERATWYRRNNHNVLREHSKLSRIRGVRVHFFVHETYVRYCWDICYTDVQGCLHMCYIWVWVAYDLQLARERRRVANEALIYTINLSQGATFKCCFCINLIVFWIFRSPLELKISHLPDYPFNHARYRM